MRAFLNAMLLRGAVITILATAGLLSGLHLAKAVPVQFGSNYYEFISVADPFTGNNNSWSTDQAAAAASVFMGVNGHLATITSQQENDFLLSLATGFSGFAGAWLGGKAPEGWLAGPENGTGFTFTNWYGIEPNNSGYAYMSIGTINSPGKWLDDSNVQGVPDSGFDPVVGYFVEYESPRATPLPATLPLFASGLAALGLLGWRRKKTAAAIAA